MAADFVIKQGDSAPVLTDTLTYSDGTAVNLTGATVTFTMRSLTAAAAQIAAAPATVTTPTAGAVSYTFSATDSAVAGNYAANWQVTFPDTSVMTFPTDGYLDIWVEPNLTASAAQQLVGLADAKDYLNIPASDRSHDQKLLRFIAGATPVVEHVTGPIVARQCDEFYDGTGSTHIVLRHRPLLNLLAVSMFQGPTEFPMAIVTTPQAGSIYSCMADTGNRVVRRGPGGSVLPWWVGPQSVHIVYTAGFTAVPENVRLGTLELLRENYQPTQQGGHPQFGAAQDPDAALDRALAVGYFMSPRVRAMLGPNRRHPSIF